MRIANQLPEPLPPERFIGLLSHLAQVRAVVGDHFAIMVVEIDQLDRISRQHGPATTRECADTLDVRLRETIPVDSLVARLRDNAVALLAFGADTEAGAVKLAGRLHRAVRHPIVTRSGDLSVTASIGVAFTNDGVHPMEALRAAERAVERVRQNGGDATWVDDHTGGGRIPPRLSQQPAAATTPRRKLFSIGN